MKPRYYQSEAAESALIALEEGYNPVLQLATGTGKSLILSMIASHYRYDLSNVWMLTHVQQLVGQNAIAYKKFTGNSPGIVCSGMGMAQYDKRVTFGTVQSMKHPVMHGLIPPPDLILIDEAHRVPHNTEDTSIYEQIFREYPNARRVGLSATPWRMDNGLIYGDGSQYWFDKLAYTYTVPRAVHDGYLSPLVGVETEFQLDLEDVSVEGGEFVQREVTEAQTLSWLKAVIGSIMQLARNRKRIAVYCPTVKSAMKVSGLFTDIAGWDSEVITGATPREERNRIFSAFRDGSLRVLVSVDTITTGFDEPALDCLVCLRPTLSSSLWVQIQGRGTRLSPEKKNCLVLDYVGNYQRLGGVDMLDSYVREVGLDVVEEIPAAEIRKPHLRKERKILPGVRSLKPIDPMTGREAVDGSCLTLDVHSVSAVPIKPRSRKEEVLLVQFACTTAENARIDAALFVNTESPKGSDAAFFKNRQLAVYLPSPAKKVIWQVRNSRVPKQVIARKNGRYWNVLEEIW